MYKFAFCLSLLIYSNVSAQKFKAFATIGGNLAQIDGDQLAGFDQIGLNLGAGIKYNLSPIIDVGTEFLYSSRGSANSLLQRNIQRIGLRLTYADVPVIVTFKDWYVEDGNYSRVFLQTGAQYSRFINGSTNHPEFEYPLTKIKNSDLSYLIGFGFNFSPRFGLAARYTRSLYTVYDEVIKKVGNFKLYYWAIRFEYNL
jgi:hypothetical protein